MAVDIAAIRRRIEQLQTKGQQPSKMWHPQPGSHRIRILPWPDPEQGMPFKERWFYYFVRPALLTATQFGKPDPINELLKKLWSTGKPEDRDMAKKLKAKLRAFAPIIVRDADDPGPFIWAFNPTILQKLLSYWEDGDVGDITDINDGFDINVVITKAPGQEYPNTAVEAARRPSKLSNDPALVKKWLSSIPSLDEIHVQKSYQEMEKALNDFLTAPSKDEQPNTSVNDEKTSQSRGKGTDPLDAIVNDVKKSQKKKELVPDETVTVVKSKTLDDVFDELKSPN